MSPVRGTKAVQRISGHRDPSTGEWVDTSGTEDLAEFVGSLFGDIDPEHPNDDEQ